MDAVTPESAPAETPVTQEPEQAPETKTETTTDETSESKTPESADADESVTSSEDAKHEQKTGNKAEKRIKQLVAQRKALEERVAALEKGKPPEEKKNLEEPKEPNISEYDTLEKYNEALKDFKSKYGEYVKELGRREAVEAAQKEKLEGERKRLIAEIEKREAKTAKRNPEYDRQEAYSTVRPSQAMDGFLVDSEIGPDILWELHENPDEADRIREMQPLRAIRELVKLEDRLLAQIKGINPASKPKPAGSYVSDKGAAPKEDVPLWEKLYK